MESMNKFLYLLPLVLCPVSAQVADAGTACRAALDAVQKAQSDNLGPVVTAVLDATGGDEQAYFRLMREAADAGHPVALTWTAGQMLRQLNAQRAELATDPAAQKLRAAMEQAAASGYIPAVVEMAHLCGSGVGAEADEKEGMKHLMKACAAGSARARAAYLLLSGRLEKEGATGAAVASELKKNNFYVEEFLSALTAQTDEAKSQEWLTMAASHGSPGAACTLGLYYLQEGKLSLGYDFLKLAVERDHPEALAQMASLMLPDAQVPAELREFIKADTEGAIRLFQRAVLLGYTPALLPLAGELHHQPEKYSPERVFELYRMSADAGDPRGGVAFGYCLAVGRGCQQDAARGVKILHQLVDAGVPYANMALADLYFNGTGVEADMSKALSALTAAASAGVPQCYTLMAVIAHLGNASRKADPARAKVYLRMAEERGEANARASFDTLVQQGSWRFIP